MKFILPARFNVMRDPSECTTGTNILFPAGGAMYATLQYLEEHATKASSERNITMAMHNIRSSPSSKNNFGISNAVSSKSLPEKGISHYTYSRLTPMYFHSAILGETFLYSDYIVYLNACLISLNTDPRVHWTELATQLQEWTRLFELRIEWKRDLNLYRCDTLWKTVDTEKAYDLILEACSPRNVRSRLDMVPTQDRRKRRVPVY